MPFEIGVVIIKKDLKVVYPIIITKTDDKNEPYLVNLPDFNGLTEGKSVINAMEMARDYIGTTIMDKLDDKEKIPKSNDKIPATNTKNQLATLIGVNVSEYKRFHNDKTVKKTLTIPNYLNELGKRKTLVSLAS